MVESFYRFQTPVPMQKRGGARPWYELNGEESEQLEKQVADTIAVFHDLSVLDAPDTEQSEAASSGGIRDVDLEKLADQLTE